MKHTHLFNKTMCQMSVLFVFPKLIEFESVIMKCKKQDKTDISNV